MAPALSLSTLKLALVGHWRPIAIVAVVLIIASIGGVLTLRGIATPLNPPADALLTPKDGQREVALNQPLKVAFSRPVAVDRVEAALQIAPALDGALTSADSRHFTWAPTGPWTDLTQYTVTLGSFKDVAGKTTKKRVWHFTTTIVPRVMSLKTESDTTPGEGSELPLVSNLKLAFNTPMAVATVSILLNGKAAGLAWSDDAKVASFSTKGFAAGGLDLGLGASGKDQVGHPLDDTWTLHLKLVFAVSEHTLALQSPALVQIPNDSYGARDQSGLQAASMVFEYLTEGGITRLTALFMNVPDVIGPIRSGRLISFRLTRHYHGINYFSGLSAGSFAVLNADPVPTLFDTQNLYYRSHDRLPPNNLYINGSSVKTYQDSADRRFPLPTGVPVTLTGADAAAVNVPEHNSSYGYDAATGTYLKTEEGHLMNDALVNQPLHIELLVVMHAHEFVTNIVEDVGGGHGRDFDTESGGVAEFYFRGKMATGRWSVPDRSSPFVFKLDNGQPIVLPKNLVWVDVISS